MSIVIILAIIIFYLALSYKSVQNIECVKVQTTCCSCNNGGGEVCVPLSEKENYEINKSTCPENLVCATMYNCNENPCEYKDGKCDFSE